MSPTCIMLIRHAEKPVPDGALGIDIAGSPDKESLSEIGWQRARALVDFFKQPKAAHVRTPDRVFAAAAGAGSSKRPMETVTPLVRALWPANGHAGLFDVSVPKESVRDIAEKAMAADGVVLICWEHTLIHALVSALPNAPATPEKWPGQRFDVVWILEAKQGGWDFDQTPQMLLEGDQNSVIAFPSPAP